MRQSAPKRATKRWLQDAPAYIADVFDHPAFADRFTVFFRYPFADTGGVVLYLGTSETGSCSGSGEMLPHEFARYRTASSKRRIPWSDLPFATRALVARWATT